MTDRIIDNRLTEVLATAYAGTRWRGLRDAAGLEFVVEKFAPRWPTGEVHVAYRQAAPYEAGGLTMPWDEFQHRYVRFKDARGRLYQTRTEGAVA